MITSDPVGLSKFRVLAAEGRLDPTIHQYLNARFGADWSRSKQDLRWQFGFDVFRDIISREGGSYTVPRNLVENGYKIGGWISAQNSQYRSGTLSSERVSKLDECEGWAWSGQESRFDDGLQALDVFVGRVGHACVPSHLIEEGYNLGAWVHTQRSLYRAGTLKPSRVSALESRPGWRWVRLPKTDTDVSYEEGLVELRRFVKKNGSARVPDGLVVRHTNLAVWVKKRRLDYDRGRLSSAQIAELAAIEGWVWTDSDQKFFDGLEALMSYAERNGDMRAPVWVYERGVPLNRWMSDQRRAYRRRYLSADRIEALEALTGWGWVINSVPSKAD